DLSGLHEAARSGGLYAALPLVLVDLAQAALYPQRSLRALRWSARRRRPGAPRTSEAGRDRNRREGSRPQHRRDKQGCSDLVRILRLAARGRILPIPPLPLST